MGQGSHDLIGDRIAEALCWCWRSASGWCSGLSRPERAPWSVPREWADVRLWH